MFGCGVWCSAMVLRARRAFDGRVPELEVSARLAPVWSFPCQWGCQRWWFASVIMLFGCGCAGVLSSF
ncbi:hypothetical protein RHMOL_Rhmol12G0100700 [Rhododendron molle]|uniref:Uncharacterized protein n=1 Tax=Rhododendron molle TaxID=49168 RepID=A0ACC0LGJ1_RHOML|nr:hypothetical protein RHMOL_Rhmol12G0100700 [Rhododendron molle]